MESRLLGFLCFPYSVISIACFGNACHEITITAGARFLMGNHLSELLVIRQPASISFVSERVGDLHQVCTGS